MNEITAQVQDSNDVAQLRDRYAANEEAFRDAHLDMVMRHAAERAQLSSAFTNAQNELVAQLARAAFAAQRR